MFQKSETHSLPIQTSDIQNARKERLTESTILEQAKVIRHMNETMDENPLLKEYFYSFLVKNNNNYQIFTPQDEEEFDYRKKKIERKTEMTYLGMCAAFSAGYLLRYGLKRRGSMWSHCFKLVTVGLILPAIPANSLAIRLCNKEREDLLQIADKYPINDERLYRDFIAYSLPALRAKFCEELDKKKERME